MLITRRKAFNKINFIINITKYLLQSDINTLNMIKNHVCEIIIYSIVINIRKMLVSLFERDQVLMHECHAYPHTY